MISNSPAEFKIVLLNQHLEQRRQLAISADLVQILLPPDPIRVLAVLITSDLRDPGHVLDLSQLLHRSREQRSVFDHRFPGVILCVSHILLLLDRLYVLLPSKYFLRRFLQPSGVHRLTDPDKLGTLCLRFLRK